MDTKGASWVNLSRRAGIIGPIGASDLALERLKKHYAKQKMTLGQAACAEPKELWDRFKQEIVIAEDEMSGNTLLSVGG